MKKLSIQISAFMKEILNHDKENFNLELGSIGNRIFEYYSDKEIDKLNTKTKYPEKLQFNLSKDNEDIFFTVLKEHNYQNESEYMRDVIFTYINNPRYQREKILFSKKFKEIENAIERNKKINIKYNNIVRAINPYFLKVANNENLSYLFCYCEESEDYRCYRVSEIETIFISKNDLEIKDREYIKAIEKNFDPFRSYGKIVKLKLSKSGEQLLKRVAINRPKLIKRDGEVFTFECDEKLAQIYFAQFFEEVEILEPETLRGNFKEKIEKAYKIYRGEK